MSSRTKSPAVRLRVVRAVDRLRGHQDPAFRLREVPAADNRLTTQMKSVGEVMAIGRTFQESFQKALRGLEVGVDGMNEKTQDREILKGTGRVRSRPHLVRVTHSLPAGRWTIAQHHQDRQVVPGADRRDRQDRTRAGELSKNAWRLRPRCADPAQPQAKGLLGPPPGKLLHTSDKAVR
jgi:carbamoyl-phosphate synthase large subunit